MIHYFPYSPTLTFADPFTDACLSFSTFFSVHKQQTFPWPRLRNPKERIIGLLEGLGGINQKIKEEEDEEKKSNKEKKKRKKEKKENRTFSAHVTPVTFIIPGWFLYITESVTY